MKRRNFFGVLGIADHVARRLDADQTRKVLGAGGFDAVAF
jgi:hypothetical protein